MTDFFHSDSLFHSWKQGKENTTWCSSFVWIDIFFMLRFLLKQANVPKVIQVSFLYSVQEVHFLGQILAQQVVCVIDVMKILNINLSLLCDLCIISIPVHCNFPAGDYKSTVIWSGCICFCSPLSMLSWLFLQTSYGGQIANGWWLAKQFQIMNLTVLFGIFFCRQRSLGWDVYSTWFICSLFKILRNSIENTVENIKVTWLSILCEELWCVCYSFIFCVSILPIYPPDKREISKISTAVKIFFC